MLEAFGLSDPGCVRPNNEDYYLLAPSLGLFLVADGMGGAQAGEHASQLASETVGEVVWRSSDLTTPEILINALEEANRRVLNAASADTKLEGMGTTLTAVLDTGSQAYIASVGDSRAYIDHQGQLLIITDDQTWVQEVGKKLGIEEAPHAARADDGDRGERPAANQLLRGGAERGDAVFTLQRRITRCCRRRWHCGNLRERR